MPKDMFTKSLEGELAKKVASSRLMPGKNTRVRAYDKKGKIKDRFVDLGPGGVNLEKAKVMERRADRNRKIVEKKYGIGWDAPENQKIRKGLTRAEKMQGEILAGKTERQYRKASDYSIKGKKQSKRFYNSLKDSDGK